MNLPEKTRLLVVDDEENMRLVLRKILTTAGYDVSEAGDGREGLKRLDQEVVDLILCDVRMPVMDGLAFLEEIQARRIQVPVIMLSAYGSVESAIQAIQKGAFDYVFKPFQPDEIILTIRKASEHQRLLDENRALRRAAGKKDQSGLVCRSRAMTDLLVMVERVAGVKSPVMITGESGTGKELIARAIHDSGPRRDMPFVAVNCGAIPDNLLESELFGHVRGAFTDAFQDRIGLFREADQGTLFLDEIAELPPALQVKLLRAIQFEEVRPVGGGSPVKVDVRVIAATARDLAGLIQGERFREDLYYRLNVLPLHILPLRERRDDIPALLDHFLTSLSARLNRTRPNMSREAAEALIRYDWPGNVRELENLVDRILVMAPKEVIEPGDLPAQVRMEIPRKPDREPAEDLDLKAGIRDLEARMIKEALSRCGGNRSEAARRLGISYPSMLAKIKIYRIVAD